MPAAQPSSSPRASFQIYIKALMTLSCPPGTAQGEITQSKAMKHTAMPGIRVWTKPWLSILSPKQKSQAIKPLA
jgi:hypothetical protein